MRNLLFVILSAVVVFVGACTESRTQLRVSDETARIDLERLGVRAVDIVREGLVDENNFVKDRAIKVVSVTGRKELMPIVIQVLKEDTVAVRFAAIDAIGDMRYLAPQYSLRPLLNDTDENIKIGAA